MSQIRAKIFIDKNISKHIALKGHLNKRKVIVSANEYDHNLRYLRNLIENEYKALNNQPYRLRFKCPTSLQLPRILLTNEDVRNACAEGKTSGTMHLFVDQSPGLYPPNTMKMSDSADSSTFTMVSFFTFCEIRNPEEFSLRLEELWKSFHCFGRVYVAKEGINAQMAIPTNALDAFREVTQSLPEFANISINIDHRIERTKLELDKPFKALHVRVREQIVTDGLDESLDWSRSGEELSPYDWHRELSATSGSKPLVLDCRNNYESDIGRFEGAVPLNTTFFRDTWTALDDVLKGVPKETPVYTYCTGGIRCVKVNAYLEQKLGFQNTKRLKGGIISYARYLQLKQHGNNGSAAAIDESQGSLPPVEGISEAADLLSLDADSRHVEDSKFRGVNYVFDERMGARITENIFTVCETCGAACDSYHNCHNFDCNACQAIAAVQTKNSGAPAKLENVEDTGAGSDEGREKAEALHRYSEDHCVAEPELLKALREETAVAYNHNNNIVRMLSGPLQGSLLTMLTAVAGAQNILELGTFTGYATLSFAYGLQQSAAGKAYASHPQIVTCESDPKSADIAEKYFNLSGLGHLIDLRRAAAIDVLVDLQRQDRKFDMVFIDADKKQYGKYLRFLLGEEEDGIRRQEPLLNPGALIIVDNILWKGLVLDCLGDERATKKTPIDKSELRKMELAQVMHDFNVAVKSHPDLQPVVLPIRDGLSLIRFLPK